MAIGDDDKSEKSSMTFDNREMSDLSQTNLKIDEKTNKSLVNNKIIPNLITEQSSKVSMSYI